VLSRSAGIAAWSRRPRSTGQVESRRSKLATIWHTRKHADWIERRSELRAAQEAIRGTISAEFIGGRASAHGGRATSDFVALKGRCQLSTIGALYSDIATQCDRFLLRRYGVDRQPPCLKRPSRRQLLFFSRARQFLASSQRSEIPVHSHTWRILAVVLGMSSSAERLGTTQRTSSNGSKPINGTGPITQTQRQRRRAKSGRRKVIGRKELAARRKLSRCGGD